MNVFPENYRCYDVPKYSVKLVENLCKSIVQVVKDLEKRGDPLSLPLKDVHRLLDLLYNEGWKEDER